MEDRTTMCWWRLEWGRAVSIAAILCVFNLFLYKSQQPWENWAKCGLGVALGVATVDFVFTKGNLSQRFQHIRIFTAIASGIFAAIFSKAFH